MERVRISTGKVVNEDAKWSISWFIYMGAMFDKEECSKLGDGICDDWPCACPFLWLYYLVQWAKGKGWLKLENLVNSFKFLSSTNWVDHPMHLFDYLHFSSCLMELCCKCSHWVDPSACRTVVTLKYIWMATSDLVPSILYWLKEIILTILQIYFC